MRPAVRTRSSRSSASSVPRRRRKSRASSNSNATWKTTVSTGERVGAPMLDQQNRVEQQSRIEELRQEARARLRRGDYEQALEVYDEALLLADDDETRELITINKADAMIALERTGPEVNDLPR